MIRMLACLLALAALSLAPVTASPARADDAAPKPPVTASNPLTVIKALQDLGYRASLTKDKGGDPLINSSAAGYKFFVFFYDCTENANCLALRFQAGFDTTDGIEIEKVNDWNLRFRFSKAFLDEEKDPILVMDFVTEAEGISRNAFASYLRVWDSQLASFAKEIGFD